MTFAKLSEYFEKLEKTSSRLALIDILAELFKRAKKDGVEMIVYLAQGRVAPFFAPVEIGMAEKTVAQALAMAYRSKQESVLELYGKLGDMGLVAQQLHNCHPGKPKAHPGSSGDSGQDVRRPQARMTVKEVFTTLTTIAKTSGEGTVEKRQHLFSDLLKKVDAISAKHLVRIPLGNMRLGIGDPTILDGLAKAKLGDKSKRILLEGAYNRTSDLGLIAKTLYAGGLSAVKRLKVQVGKPIRSELCERLPTAEKVIDKMGKVLTQYKFDGFRVQLHKDGSNIQMYSRNLENMTHMFPELVEGAQKQVRAQSAILDCEALAYNPSSEEFLPFQETTKRRRKYQIEEMAKQLPLKAFVFDILYRNGQSLIDNPLRERIRVLRETITEDGILIVSKTKEVGDPKELQVLLDDAISKGLEGVVVKRLDSPYEAGARNFNWVKLKRHSAGELHDTIDCVILGYIFGRGKRAAFGAGALLVGVYDKKRDEFVTVSKIGTGLTDEEWREIKVQSSKFKVPASPRGEQSKPVRVNSLIVPSVWVEPKIVIEVLADEITRSPIHTAGKTDSEPGYALRFPRLVSFRTADRKPEDATTVEELLKMYKQQSPTSNGAGQGRSNVT